MSKSKNIYDKIIARKETENYNAIDKARDLLAELLDDPEQLIGDDAGSIIQRVINFIE
jgi:hypothetical protein